MMLVVLTLALGALVLSSVDAFAQRGRGPGVTGTGQFQYVVKFLCGQLFKEPSNNPSGEFDGAPGQYYTDVNIHNPNNAIVKAKKKFALDGPRSQVHGPVTSLELFVLNPDEALQITCADIRRLVGQYPFGLGAGAQSQFIKGFVVILSRFRLDVTGIYTVCPPQTNTASLDLDLGCPNSTSTGDTGSVESLDVVYYTPSEVAPPSRLLPSSLTASQLALGGELKVELSARKMLALEEARLLVYDLNGRMLHDSGFTRGTELRWKPQAADGRTAANGVYLYVVIARDAFGRVGYHAGKFMVLR